MCLLLFFFLMYTISNKNTLFMSMTETQIIIFTIYAHFWGDILLYLSIFKVHNVNNSQVLMHNFSIIDQLLIYFLIVHLLSPKYTIWTSIDYMNHQFCLRNAWSLKQVSIFFLSRNTIENLSNAWILEFTFYDYSQPFNFFTGVKNYFCSSDSSFMM